MVNLTKSNETSKRRSSLSPMGGGSRSDLSFGYINNLCDPDPLKS